MSSSSYAHDTKVLVISISEADIRLKFLPYQYMRHIRKDSTHIVVSKLPDSTSDNTDKANFNTHCNL